MGGFSLYQDRGFIFQGARRDGVGYGFLEQAGWESSKSEALRERERSCLPTLADSRCANPSQWKAFWLAYGLLHGMDTRVTMGIICRMKQRIKNRFALRKSRALVWAVLFGP